MTLDTRQTVIAGGGPDDYLEARHAVLRGTNREIGRAIGEIARTEFDSLPLRAIDPIRARATRRYFREHYPIHEQRLLGAADANRSATRGVVHSRALAFSMELVE